MPKPPTPIAERFDKYWVVEPNTGCWLWTGCQKKEGYGVMFVAGTKKTGAHRIAYELYRGPIPEGLHIDHLCRTPGCVNPNHLEAVTLAENTRRGQGGAKAAERKAAQVFCKRGHPIAHGHPNVRYGSDGTRVCRVCSIAYKRARRAKERGGFFDISVIANGAMELPPLPSQKSKNPFCPKGHAMTPENTRLCPQGWRKCKTCHRIWVRARKARLRKQRKEASCENQTSP